MATIGNVEFDVDGITPLSAYFESGVYLFSLTVTKGDSVATATTQITLIDDVVPTVTIITDVVEKYDRSEKIIVSAEIGTDQSMDCVATFTAETELPFGSDLANATLSPLSTTPILPAQHVFQIALKPNFLSTGSLYIFLVGLLRE